MRVFRLSGLCALLVLGVACSPDSVSGPALSYAAATSFCGPTDGPAVVIYLANAPITSLEPSPPYFRIAIWQPVDRLEGGSWTVAGTESGGAAWHHPNATDFEIATGGIVHVEGVSDARTIEGFVNVTFSGAGRIRESSGRVGSPGRCSAGRILDVPRRPRSTTAPDDSAGAGA